jgi:hypothetical protein
MTAATIEAQAPGELAVLELLAALLNPQDRSSLMQWHKQLCQHLAETRAPQTRELRSMLERLVERGLVGITPNGRGYYVADTCRHEVLASTERANRLRPLTDAIRAVEPVRGEHGWSTNPKALTRELAWSLHLGLHRSAQKEYATWDERRMGHDSRAVLLVNAWGLHVPADLSRVPVAIIQDYLALAGALANAELLPLPASVLAWTEAHAAEYQSPAVSEIATHLALRGETARAQALLASQDDPRSLARRAFIALTADDFGSARALARDALERTRTKSSKRIKGVDDHAGVWLVLALLTDRDADSQLYAHAQLELERKRHGSTIIGCLELIDGLVSSGADAVPPLMDTFVRRDSDWIDLLFHALFVRFCGRHATRTLTDGATKLAKLARSRGFAWVQTALQAATSPGTRSLVQLYQPTPPWQRKLRALEVALATAHPSAASAPGHDRLAWVVTFGAKDEFALTAYLQMQTQRGWSSGRQLSWKRLAEASPPNTFITDFDRRVLRHVRVEREFNGYGSTPRFVLDPKAVLALVGHPCVFLDGEPRIPVEVVEGAARLEIHDDRGESVLTLAPESLLRRTVVCEREGHGRLVVYALDEAQARVAGVFEQAPFRLPIEARAFMKATLAKLAGHFSLASEHALPAAWVEEVPADVRPRVRLRRRGEGLAIRVCVVPLPEAAAFAPGHGSAHVVVRVAADGGATNVCAVRDLDAERQALLALYARCPSLSDALGGEHEGVLDDLDACLGLLCELRAAGDVVVEWPDSQPFELTQERDVAHMRLRLQTETDWLGVEGELAIDESLRLSLHELLARAAAARSRFVLLDDGRYLALTNELKKALDGMSALARVDRTRVALHPLWLTIAGASDRYADLQCDPQIARALERVREASELEAVPPPGFEAELRSYQREGFAWLCRLAHMRAGACLADDMGLGKTLQTLALLVAESAHGPSLVVAPTSVCSNWFEEARRFAPSLRLLDLASGDRAETIRQLGARDVLVCSYGLLQQELEALSAKHFRVAILDEAQAIKNASTQRARAAQQLVADIRIALTGTPVENHLGDLWSIMNFLNPGLLGSAKAFEERFTKPIARDADARAARTLKRLIRPFMLRRRKSEVLEDLPPKTVVTLHVEPSEAERALSRRCASAPWRSSPPRTRALPPTIASSCSPSSPACAARPVIQSSSRPMPSCRAASSKRSRAYSPNCAKAGIARSCSANSSTTSRSSGPGSTRSPCPTNTSTAPPAWLRASARSPPFKQAKAKSF